MSEAEQPLVFASLSKSDRQKIRREMIKQARLMLKGSVMSSREVKRTAEAMADLAISREMKNGKTERSRTQ